MLFGVLVTIEIMTVSWTDTEHISFSRYAFLTDLSELKVDFYSLLLFVLIIWQCTHDPASTGNIK